LDSVLTESHVFHDGETDGIAQRLKGLLDAAEAAI
jgi:hypothetical protein